MGHEQHKLQELGTTPDPEKEERARETYQSCSTGFTANTSIVIPSLSGARKETGEDRVERCSEKAEENRRKGLYM